jgi:Domain of unknown function (DUF5916)
VWGIQLALRSPGFEINDVGQMTRADAVDFNADYGLRDTKPQRLWRYIELSHSTQGQWDYALERQFQRFNQRFTLALNNFWTLTFQDTYTPRGMSDNQTRGGTYMLTPHSWFFQGTLSGNHSKPTTWSLAGSYQKFELGGKVYNANAVFTVQPAARWQASFTPRYFYSINPRQYITTVAGGGAATFGSRYLFAYVEQSTLAAQFRLNFAFTPDLTLQGYAEPFASSGRYYGFGELAQPRTFDLRSYGQTPGTTLSVPVNGTYTVTDGAARFSFTSPDFNLLSFRSNLVLRWEWLPGSTLFLIWQQSRSNTLPFGDLVRPGALWDATTAPGDNFLAVKLSYWLNVK